MNSLKWLLQACSLLLMCLSPGSWRRGLYTGFKSARQLSLLSGQMLWFIWLQFAWKIEIEVDVTLEDKCCHSAEKRLSSAFLTMNSKDVSLRFFLQQSLYNCFKKIQLIFTRCWKTVRTRTYALKWFPSWDFEGNIWDGLHARNDILPVVPVSNVIFPDFPLIAEIEKGLNKFGRGTGGPLKQQLAAMVNISACFELETKCVVSVKRTRTMSLHLSHFSAISIQCDLEQIHI